MQAATCNPPLVAPGSGDGGTRSRRAAGSLRLAATPTPSRSPEDEELSHLLTATSRGDRRAFARLYGLTSARLFAVALRILGHRDPAEDVLQDAFLAIWQQAGQHRPSAGSALGWMMTVVRHRAIDRLRRDRRSPVERYRELERVVCGGEAGLDESLAADCMGDALRECIAKLPINHRNAILAAFVHGLTHEELAQRLDVPIGTAKSWVRRGLRQLRACLESRQAR